MSTLESLIWNIVGYAAMPIIFFIGFVVVAAASLLILSLWSDKKS